MVLRINIPPLTRAILLLLAAITCLNATLRYRAWAADSSTSISSRKYYAPYLTVVPGVSIIYPWTFVTAAFVEQNVLGLLITGLTVFYGGRYLERAWSSPEFTKFILLVSILPNILCFFTYVILYAATSNTDLLTTSISGGIATQGAFLVSFKQLVPEHTVTIAKGIVSVRVKHFPAIFLLSNTISGIVLGTDTAMILAWLGVLISWIYLRFYRMSPSLTTASTGEGPVIRGDASDTFAFAYFFPEPLSIFISPLADGIYNLMVTIRICIPFSTEDVDAGNEQAKTRGEGGLPGLLNAGGRGGAGGGRREEAERRRALALKALDQRLHTARAKPQNTATSSTLGETNNAPEPETTRIADGAS